MADALEQIELADRLGLDCIWLVEHHFLEEYSHSSAPEVFLGAASQRTKQIRLGHGIVQLPVEVNHPARVAERVATLDLLSHGRLEFGTGEGSSQAELGGFGVPRGAKRDQWEEALDVICRMLAEEPFTGHRGRWIDVPPRNVVPKPWQTPHPPLWVACSRRETIELAGRRGLGVLSFSFIAPEDAKPWVDMYYELLGSDECVPAGLAVNPNFAVVVPFMCHPDEETAIERGIDGAHFFGYSLAHYYVFGRHRPAHTSVWDEFERYRTRARLRPRHHSGRPAAPRHQGAPRRRRLAPGRRRHARADRRAVRPLRGGRGRPGDLRRPSRPQPPRARLRGARPVREAGAAPFRRRPRGEGGGQA